jgi:hypothetical protein
VSARTGAVLKRVFRVFECLNIYEDAYASATRRMPIYIPIRPKRQSAFAAPVQGRGGAVAAQPGSRQQQLRIHSVRARPTTKHFFVPASLLCVGGLQLEKNQKKETA